MLLSSSRTSILATAIVAALATNACNKGETPAAGSPQGSAAGTGTAGSRAGLPKPVNQPELDQELDAWVKRGGTLFVVYYDPEDSSAKAIGDSVILLARRDMGPNARVMSAGKYAPGSPDMVRGQPPAWPVIYTMKGAEKARVFIGMDAFQRALSVLYPAPAATRKP